MKPRRVAKNKVESNGYRGRLQAFLTRTKKLIAQSYQTSRAQILYYIPGIFLLSMGFSLLVDPSSFIWLASSFLVYLGAMTIVLGRKLVVVSVKFKEVVRQVEARVYLKGQPTPDHMQWENQKSDEQVMPDKKTVFH